MRTVAVLTVLLLVGCLPAADDKLPKAVTEAFAAKWPKASVQKWVKKTQDGEAVLELDFKVGEVKHLAVYDPDGTLDFWEREMATKDLPAAVRQAIDKKYPKAALKEALQVTEVKDKKETLEGYSVVLLSAEKQEVEVLVAPDGKFLEDSSEPKKK